MIRILLKDQLYSNLQEVFSIKDDYIKYVLSSENLRSKILHTRIKFNSSEEI